MLELHESEKNKQEEMHDVTEMRFLIPPHPLPFAFYFDVGPADLFDNLLFIFLQRRVERLTQVFGIFGKNKKFLRSLTIFHFK